jgi:hypothetical protein
MTFFAECRYDRNPVKIFSPEFFRYCNCELDDPQSHPGNFSPFRTSKRQSRIVGISAFLYPVQILQSDFLMLSASSYYYNLNIATKGVNTAFFYS